ncbi:MAG: hypothetical protein KA138_05475 [Saprospiraceae bacterium]|nr:hypothetical protein [Saprospiraceae bacterium]
MSTAVRRFLIVLSIFIALLIIATVVFVRGWLDPLLKEKLIEMTAQSSQGIYTLQIDRLHVSLFTGSAEADGIQLTTDSIRWDSIRQVNPDETPLKIELQIERLRLKNLNLLKYWRTKDISLSKILVRDPQISLTSVKDTAIEKSPKNDSLIKGMLDRLPLLIAPFSKSIHIGSVTASNGKMSLRTLFNSKTSFQVADSIALNLSNINIVANDTTTIGRALYAEYISLSLHNYELYPTGDLYGYRINSAIINGQKELTSLEGITILPKASDADFMQRLSIRTPRLKIRMQEILINKLDLFRALHKKELNMESVIVESARIDVYQNKNLPLSRHKRMPHELFRSIKPYLNIDTILLRNSNILYTEYHGDQEGQIEFEKVNGVILNITNDTLKMSDATPARIDARAELMGAGLLDLSLQIPLLSPSFRCDYSANLGKIDMTYLNRLVEDQNKFRVESGNAESMILKVQVRNGLAQGTLEATYDDLKISVLRKKDGSKKKMISVVANIILRGKNERGSENKPFKVANIYYRREPTDGILRFIWRSAQTGLMETLVPRNISGGKMPD